MKTESTRTHTQEEVAEWWNSTTDQWWKAMTWFEPVAYIANRVEPGDVIIGVPDKKGVLHWEINGKKLPKMEYGLIAATVFLDAVGRLKEKRVTLPNGSWQTRYIVK